MRGREALRFWGNEIVRLKDDHTNDGLKADDCGVGWGVYDLDPTLYEATFIDENGSCTGMMFDELDVEEVPDAKETSFSEKLDAVRCMLNMSKIELQRSRVAK